MEYIEHNGNRLKEAKKSTGSVAIALDGDPSIMAGRHFEKTDNLVSMVSRRSIDCLKEHFREDVTRNEWILIMTLKPYFNIV